MTGDPTHIEARYRGALREITPAHRAEWEAADRAARRTVFWLRIIFAVGGALIYVVLRS